MAKIKVHEIAKEMEKQSKEIIAFLQNKGIEVKAAQSVLEEEAANMVRKAFGKEADKGAEIKVQAKQISRMDENKAETGQEAKPEKKQEVKEAGQGEQPKKRKKIIFVSNPHNSNIPTQRSLGERRQGQGTQKAQSQGNSKNQGQGTTRNQGQGTSKVQNQGTSKTQGQGKQGNKPSQGKQSARPAQGNQRKEVPHKTT